MAVAFGAILAALAPAASAQAVGDPHIFVPGQCIDGIYLTSAVGGVPGFAALDPATMQWPVMETYAQPLQAIAYAADRGFGYAVTGTWNDFHLAQFGAHGEMTESAQVVTPELTMARGAIAALGYDIVNQELWFAQAYTPNRFLVFDVGAVDPADWGGATIPFRIVDFGLDTTPASPQTSGTPGPSQLTDIVIIGGKVFAVANRYLFVYDPARAGQPNDYAVFDLTAPTSRCRRRRSGPSPASGRARRAATA